MDPATTAPPAPVVDLQPVAADTTLHVVATRAYTRASIALTRTVHTAPVPDVRADEAVVATGTPTRIRVISSRPDEIYQLRASRQALGVSQQGTGDDLVFDTPTLHENTVFEMDVTRPDDTRLPLHRIVLIPVEVRPA